MNLGAQSGLLAAIVCAAIAVSVLLRARRGLVSVLFTLFCANLFVHFVAALLHDLSGSALWVRADLAAAALLPVSAMLFFAYFLWQVPSLPRRYLKITYLLSGSMIVFLLTPWGHGTLSHALVGGYTFGALYLCAFLITTRIRELESARERTRLRYLLVFHLVSVSFVVLGLLPGPLQFLRTWGNLVSVFYLYFVSQSLLKYRLLDLQDLLGRGLVLSAVALVLAIVFGILVGLTGGSPETSLFHTFVAAIVILILFEPLRDKVEGSAGRLFFRERFELQRKLEELRREVANQIDIKKMVEALLDTPFEKLRIANANLYLQDDSGAGYRLAGHRGHQPAERIEVAAQRSFFDQLKKAPTVVLSETFERHLAEHGAPADSEPSGDAKRARQILDTLATMQASICIPLVGSTEVLGLWNLQDDLALESTSTEELALLMAVGEQAAINIENSRMYERIRERDRLAVLGEMAAGLAHEIRNPLGAIKGAAQYLDPTAVGEDGEFLQIIIDEANRLNHVVDQFLDYARPLKAPLEPTDVNRVVQQTVRLLPADLASRGIELELELASDLPPVQATAPQLTQVLLNLLNNAIEALSGTGGGRVAVRARLRPAWPGWDRSARGGAGAVLLEIADDGPGIPQELRARIFVPFFTTKERGTGLGLAICQRIIQGLGGEIRPDSRPGQGAAFLITLPAALPAEGRHGRE